MPSNQPLSSVAADIVSAALSREKIDPKALGTFGYLSLIKGRPHLYDGMRALLSHPALPFLTLLQVAIVYVIVHDISQSIAQYPDYLLLGDMLFTVQHFFHLKNFIFAGFIAAVPLFALLSLSWGLMASIFSRQLRPSVLLTSLGGLVSFRLLSLRYIPAWWIFMGDIRASMSISGRMLQFLMAYKLATGKSNTQIEIDFARVFNAHFKKLMKAYCSYALHPVIWVGGCVCAFLIAMYFGGLLYPTSLNQFLNGLHFFSVYFPHLSLPALICAWFAFERSCLGAMTFSFLEEAENPNDSSHWLNAMPVAVLLFVSLYLLCSNMDGLSQVPYPQTEVIDPIVKYGIYDPTTPSTRTIATAGCHLERLQKDNPETIRFAFEGCSMGNLHIVGNSQYTIMTLRGKDGQKVLKAFVRPRESLDILLPVGDYTASYDSGEVWYGTSYLFGLSTRHGDPHSFSISPTPFFGRKDLSESEEFLYQLGLPEDDMKNGYSLHM